MRFLLTNDDGIYASGLNASTSSRAESQKTETNHESPKLRKHEKTKASGQG